MNRKKAALLRAFTPKYQPVFIEATSETIDKKLEEQYSLVPFRVLPYYYRTLENGNRELFELFMHKAGDGKSGWKLHYSQTIKPA